MQLVSAGDPCQRSPAESCVYLWAVRGPCTLDAGPCGAERWRLECCMAGLQQLQHITGVHQRVPQLARLPAGTSTPGVSRLRRWLPVLGVATLWLRGLVTGAAARPLALSQKAPASRLGRRT